VNGFFASAALRHAVMKASISSFGAGSVNCITERSIWAARGPLHPLKFARGRPASGRSPRGAGGWRGAWRMTRGWARAQPPRR